MKIPFLLFACCLSAGTVYADNVKIAPAAVNVVLMDEEDNGELSAENGQFITLVLCCDAPGTLNFIKQESGKGKDTASSTLKIKDSTGKDLGEVEHNPFFDNISQNKKQLVAAVHTESLPAKGAQWIHVTGTLPVTMSGGVNKTTPKLFETKKDVKIPIGKLVLKVKEVSPAPSYSSNKDGVYIEFSLETGEKDIVEALTFTTADGSPIKATKTGSGRFSLGKKTPTPGPIPSLASWTK